MQKGLVTVVVPIYKSEKYLDRCVASIVDQTYRDLEIILVDDGSPDNCPQMCEQWARQDSRIKVIHKQNQGAGMARNTGIDHASGEYICFFDSDDHIAVDTIALAYDLAQKERADTVIFGLASVDSVGRMRQTYLPKPKKNQYCGAQVRSLLLPDMIGPDPETGISAALPLSACCQLISMELITQTGWRFVSEREILSEDIYSIIALYARVRKAAVLPRTLYYYCENRESMSHTYQPNRYEQMKNFYIQLLQLCEDCGYTAAVRGRCAELFLGSAIADMKQETAHHERKTAMARLRTIVDDELLQKTIWEKRSDKTNLQKRLLLRALRRKRYGLCYALLAAKNAAEHPLQKRKVRPHEVQDS